MNSSHISYAANEMAQKSVSYSYFFSGENNTHNQIFSGEPHKVILPVVVRSDVK